MFGQSSYSELEYGKCKGPIGITRNMLTCDQGIPIPQGSYLQSCNVVRFVDDQLWTDCKKSNGTYNFNSLDNVSRCVGDIENDGGFPRCSVGGPPPPGSYTLSCGSVFRSNDKLTAKCRLNGSTAVRASTLASISACSGVDIFNEDGFLKCIPAPVPPPPAPKAAPPPAPPPPPPPPTIFRPVAPPNTLKTAPPPVMIK